MTDIVTRKDGVAGRITLTRPKALNALNHEMCLEIEAALDAWREDEDVRLIVIDAEGERAFCAGGDIAAMYAAGKAGDFESPRTFWRDEYRMNAKMAEFPRPVVAFMQGFVMGGGVGVGCHASHRVVGESSQVAMPESGIGLIPDVGGSLLLAQAPGRLGEYLAVTGARMNAADAILAGFADYFVPEADWEALKAALVADGDLGRIDAASQTAPEGKLSGFRETIDRTFAGDTLGDIVRALRHEGGEFAEGALKIIGRNSPLSMACGVELVHRLRGTNSIRRSLELEYRFTARAMEHGDFLEGVRAQIIDKDRNPRWKHEGPEVLPAVDVARMLMPLGDAGLKFEEEVG
ncbi:enoyl-CoA hydratase/isomerase family protein [Ostreiculturibacter nitratireducens]|uniref:enoyl-CoA hydratase/isomerase family protein n=1 Tax=Ostreiculturibacter nitratireducens TaxID=3075226 RepID=UPI0031B5FBF0